jgi:hypothetical protein
VARRRNLVALDLVLLVASLPGIVNALAKDHVSTAEGVIAWISAVLFLVAVLGFVVLLAVGLRRFADRS